MAGGSALSARLQRPTGARQPSVLMPPLQTLRRTHNGLCALAGGPIVATDRRELEPRLGPHCQCGEPGARSGAGGAMLAGDECARRWAGSAGRVRRKPQTSATGSSGAGAGPSRAPRAHKITISTRDARLRRASLRAGRARHSTGAHFRPRRAPSREGQGRRRKWRRARLGRPAPEVAGGALAAASRRAPSELAGAAGAARACVVAG